MKNTTSNQRVAQSTYTLLVRSEEPERSLSETAVYLLLILCAVFSIWQVAQQPVNFAVGATSQTAPVAQTAPMRAERV